MKICNKTINQSDKAKWIDHAITERFLKTNIINTPLLQDMVFAACNYAEQYTRRSIIRQSITVLLDPDDSNADGSIFLPYPPIISVSSTIPAAQSNTDTDSTTANAGNLINEQGLWRPSAGASSNARRLTYIAGYNTMSDVPPLLLCAILEHVYNLYVNRSETPPLSSQAAYAQFRQIKL